MPSYGRRSGWSTLSTSVALECNNCFQHSHYPKIPILKIQPLLAPTFFSSQLIHFGVHPPTDRERDLVPCRSSCAASFPQRAGCPPNAIESCGFCHQIDQFLATDYCMIPVPCDALLATLCIEDLGFGDNRERDGQYSVQGGYSVSFLCYPRL